MKAIMTKMADMDLIGNGPYVEYSKIEVPKNVKDAIFNEHLRICPKNANITDDEIQEMVNDVRYGKRYR